MCPTSCKETELRVVGEAVRSRSEPALSLEKTWFHLLTVRYLPPSSCYPWLSLVNYLITYLPGRQWDEGQCLTVVLRTWWIEVWFIFKICRVKCHHCIETVFLQQHTNLLSTNCTLCGNNPLASISKGNGECQVKNCSWIFPVDVC